MHIPNSQILILLRTWKTVFWPIYLFKGEYACHQIWTTYVWIIMCLENNTSSNSNNWVKLKCLMVRKLKCLMVRKDNFVEISLLTESHFHPSLHAYKFKPIGVSRAIYIINYVTFRFILVYLLSQEECLIFTCYLLAF